MKAVKLIEEDIPKGREGREEKKRIYKVLNSLPDPTPGMNLTTEQKEWWYWLGMELLATREISKPDLLHLQKAAFWMDARCSAYKEVSAKGYDGLVQTFKNGTTNITGHISIIEKADKHLDEVSVRFGFSIMDRGRLKLEKEIDMSSTNLFDEIKNNLTKV